MSTKRLHGQFFTITNPFEHPAFLAWAKRADIKNKKLLEPFAGANHLVKMLDELELLGSWASFDIEPKAPGVRSRDTLKSFPSGYDVVVTNPPYLAKNSATRLGFSFPETHYDDLYKLAIDRCLSGAGYVAAIIPESFITTGLYRNRLSAVVSLTCRMFDDTDHPVCLAMFEPKVRDTKVYSGTKLLGRISELERHKPSSTPLVDVTFNDPEGQLGLYAVDGTKGPTIRFCAGKEIDSSRIHGTSRSITRIRLNKPLAKHLDDLVESSNAYLNSYRLETGDVFLTSFKGLRKDGSYRRRLDFQTARTIISQQAKLVSGELVGS